MSVPNILATRYASAAMRSIWTPENKIRATVMEAQADLGVSFGGDDPEQVLADYQAVLDDVDLDSIAEREAITRHDVKARIEEFNALAGHEHIHKGMTSRDLTENIEQMQVLESLRLVRDKMVATLNQLSRLIKPLLDALTMLPPR